MAMSRMKKGRDDRDKVNTMLARGIPGTIREESQYNPLSFNTNHDYKSSFSTYNSKPQAQQY